MKVHLEYSCFCIVAHYVVPAYILSPSPTGESSTLFLGAGGGLKDSKHYAWSLIATGIPWERGFIEQIPPLGVQGYMDVFWNYSFIIIRVSKNSTYWRLIFIYCWNTEKQINKCHLRSYVIGHAIGFCMQRSTVFVDRIDL